jgi:hypothetical protein
MEESRHDCHRLSGNRRDFEGGRESRLRICRTQTAFELKHRRRQRVRIANPGGEDIGAGGGLTFANFLFF